MNRNYLHYLITRFNVPASFAPGAGLDEGWLEHRIGLFRQFCVPSVAAQSCGDFKWILLVDARTRPENLEKIESAVAPLKPRVTLLRIKGNSVSRELREFLVGRRVPSVSSLITTRIDNDDAMHRDFCGIVQKELVGCDDTFMEFTHGYTYSPQESRLQRLALAGNAFVSRVEPYRDSLETVYCGEHQLLRTIGRMVSLPSPAAWIQVVHGLNVKNRMRGDDVAEADAILRGDFNIVPRQS